MDGVSEYFPNFSSRLNPHAGPQPPPPAPPLPPQKYSERATNALSRVTQTLLGASRPSSAQTQRVQGIAGRFGPTSVPRTTIPLSSQTTTHKTGIQLHCFDISPDGTRAILGGTNILKTIRISGATCSEEYNVRATANSYASAHISNSLRSREQFVTVDTKWSHGRFDSYIVTAASSGKMVVYDLNRPGMEVLRVQEHHRQIHRIAINPHQGALCLTASSDTMVKLWDLREMVGKRSVMTWESRQPPFRARDAVRDVKWSPTDGMEFACATDNGSVQRWDFRKDNACLVRHAAHNGKVLVIDYHPDGKHLASAGEDKNVKIWDILSTNRRQKPSWQLRAPQVVNKLAWRPAVWSSRPTSTPGGGNWETTEILTGYKEHDRRMHLWDIKRRSIPAREIERHGDVVTGFLWRSEDLLWSIGLDGMFVQTDIHFTPQPPERRSLMSFDWSPSGDFAFFGAKRPRRRGSTLGDGVSGIGKGRNRSGGSSGERSSGSRSTTEYGGDDGFLSSSTRRVHARTSSFRSAKSTSGYTPPSTTTPPVKLDELMEQAKHFNSTQIGAIAHIPGTFDADVFRFLVQHYKLSVLLESDWNIRLDHRFRDAAETNAELAQECGMYRLAQTWRIIGKAVCSELKVMANERRKHRFEMEAAQARQQRHSEELANERRNLRLDMDSERGREPAEKARYSRIFSHMSADNSSMATPLARPLPDSPQQSIDGSQYGINLGDISRGEDALVLPPAVWGKTSGNNSRSGSGSKSNGGTHKGSSSTFAGNDTERRSLLALFPDYYVEDVPSRSGSGSKASNGTHQGSSSNPIENEAERRSLLALFPDYYGEDVSPESETEIRAAVNHSSGIDSNKPALRIETSAYVVPIIPPKQDFPRPGFPRVTSPESLLMFSASSDGGRAGRSGSDPFRSDLSPTREEREIHGQEEYHLLAHASGSSQESYINLGDSEASSSMSSKPGAKVLVAPPVVDPEADTSRLGKDDPMAASGTIVPDYNEAYPGHLTQRNQDGHTWANLDHDSPRQPPLGHFDDGLINEDFVVEPLATSDPSLPEVPWSAKSVIDKTVEFYCEIGDVQSAASIILLTAPFHHFSDYDRACEILHLYLQQLDRQHLLITTAFIRKICCIGGTGYDEVVDAELRNPYLGMSCGNCDKPLENVNTKRNAWICEKCENMQDPCLVCHERGVDRLWSWCQHCGHGGHDECMREWWLSDSNEGTCPGCLHDCLPGKRREERIAEEEAARLRKEEAKANELRDWEDRLGGVKPDRKVVVESRAVGKTKGLLKGEADRLKDRLAGDERPEKRVQILEPGQEIVTPGEMTVVSARDIAGK